MIDLCHDDRDSDPSDPLSLDAFIRELSAAGVTFRRVQQPTGDAVCLMFGSIEAGTIERLSPQVRRNVVLVAEGGLPTVTEAEQTRASLELLGLVEPRAWKSWQHGLFVAWGLYGRPDVAHAAGLTTVKPSGIHLADEDAALPELLARFLIAAESR